MMSVKGGWNISHGVVCYVHFCQYLAPQYSLTFVLSSIAANLCATKGFYDLEPVFIQVSTVRLSVQKILFSGFLSCSSITASAILVRITAAWSSNRGIDVNFRGATFAFAIMSDTVTFPFGVSTRQYNTAE